MVAADQRQQHDLTFPDTQEDVRAAQNQLDWLQGYVMALWKEDGYMHPVALAVLGALLATVFVVMFFARMLVGAP